MYGVTSDLSYLVALNPNRSLLMANDNKMTDAEWYKNFKENLKKPFPPMPKLGNSLTSRQQSWLDDMMEIEAKHPGFTKLLFPNENHGHKR